MIFHWGVHLSSRGAPESERERWRGIVRWTDLLCVNYGKILINNYHLLISDQIFWSALCGFWAWIILHKQWVVSVVLLLNNDDDEDGLSFIVAVSRCLFVKRWFQQRSVFINACNPLNCRQWKNFHEIVHITENVLRFIYSRWSWEFFSSFSFLYSFSSSTFQPASNLLGISFNKLIHQPSQRGIQNIEIF